MMEENVEMVAVATASQTMDATMIQVELDSCGIDSQLYSELTVAANPLLSNAVGGIRILVSARDFARASAILAERAQAKMQAAAIVAKTCPRCGDENGKARHLPIWVGILMILTLGAYSLLFPFPRYVCPRCKNKW